jgi:hypothetical protein
MFHAIHLSLSPTNRLFAGEGQQLHTIHPIHFRSVPCYKFCFEQKMKNDLDGLENSLDNL